MLTTAPFAVVAGAPAALIGQRLLAFVFRGRSGFENTAYVDVGVCTHVSPVRVEGGSTGGGGGTTLSGLLFPVSEPGGVPVNAPPPPLKTVVFDGVILRSINATPSLSDTAQQLRTLQAQSWAQAECQRQFRFLNMPFELKTVHVSFDGKICVVYYQINTKEDTSSEPNVSRLLRVLQYHLSCKVHLARWPVEEGQNERY
ncbi:unnamed protein product [Phytomonas sp. EM1]|nr:unnamed protein product [Phytomonas sp. EM1]|eukprot:CCW61662.1 unnamed protein product [Phytomonas sp. isolate EM1]